MRLNWVFARGQLKYSVTSPALAVSLLSLFFLLLTSGIFSSLETALTSLSNIQLQELEQKKDRRSRALYYLMERLEQTLITLLIGNNLVNVGAASLVSAITIRLYGELFLGISAGLLTIFILIFGEVTPKRLALLHGFRIARNGAIPLLFLQLILLPISIAVGKFSSLLMRIFPKEKKELFNLKSLFFISHAAEKSGSITEQESRILTTLARFRDITVKDLCTHRSDVFSLPVDISPEEALNLILDSPFYTVIPLYEKSSEEIVGIVRTRDIIESVTITPSKKSRLGELKRPATFVPGSFHLDEFFQKIHDENLRLAIVLDEYGGLEGVITSADLVETMWGLPTVSSDGKILEEIQLAGNGKWFVDGETELSHFVKKFDLSEHTENSAAKTVAGWLMEHSSTVLTLNDSLKLPWGEFQITETNNQKIEKILFSPRREAIRERDPKQLSWISVYP